MQIVQAFPPNIEEIKKVFPLSGGEIFAYGDIIYSPYSATLPDELVAHERVHQRQQGDDVEGWWKRYLVDKGFRLRMETEAHIVEWQTIRKTIKDRNARVKECARIARKLAAPLYGKVISYRKAMDTLRKAP